MKTIDLDGVGNALENCYNFLVYRFEVAEGTIEARAYADEMDRALIFLPDDMTFEHADALRVLQYLARRYSEIRGSGNVHVEVEQTYVRPTPPR
jgi:hypothetical protein